MTREEARKAAKVMMAYAEGKEIEFSGRKPGGCQMWEETSDPTFNWYGFMYRTKTKPVYRPFNDMEECWQEMLKHRPFGWLKNKERESVILIGNVYMDKEVLIVWATNERNSNSASKVFNKYVFTDGTPFGIKED